MSPLPVRLPHRDLACRRVTSLLRIVALCLWLPLPSLTAARTPIPVASDCPLGHVSRQAQGPTPKPVIAIQKRRWEARHGGKEAAKEHIRARLSALPSQFLVDKSTLPKSDEELAWRIARDTWKGIRAFTDKHNGLPVDHVRVAPGRAPGAIQLEVADYANVTSIGLYLIAIAAARDLDLLAAREAEDTARRVLDSLRQLERRRGLFFNYYDTTSLERTSSFVSFVDSAWLTAGLIVARQAFPGLRAKIDPFIDAADFGLFYDPKTHRVAHGFFLEPRLRSPYDYGVLYTEARLGSLIAIGKGDIGREHWLTLWRVLPSGCEWQSIPPMRSVTHRVDGFTVVTGQYEWRGEPFVASWGGSMFEALMPTLVLDEPRFAPASLGWNDAQHAKVQRRYAREELRYPVWGMSPARTPRNDGYSEYGVSVLGVRGYGAGAVSPHASALALAVTPQAALENLRHLAFGFDLYGEFGFYDSVDPSTGDVSSTYLTLDQLMLFLALANYLEPHCVQEHFAADMIVKRFLPLLGLEDSLWNEAAANAGAVPGSAPTPASRENGQASAP